ncbi:Calcium channel yvc1 [Coniosporium tulheliwenetii]|uniref:Calcium channel yvc1 n=1 Tax=Coniosporium tulheliwenetii TaxID=3383036 RepID=A0ACC2YKW5_9PEZI|nr:Calcium channel yvc1 [Cladosporium sp. JES 115]
MPSPIPALEVTKVALRLKYQIEQVVPNGTDEDEITKPFSRIITEKVVETAKKAGGEEHRGCVVFALLVVRRWFTEQAKLELWRSETHAVRATACEVIARIIIEGEEDEQYLIHDVLLQRYATVVGGNDTVTASVIETAVDFHALRVIASSGYQKCISLLWHGWLIQDDMDPSRFIEYEGKDNHSFWARFDPRRLRVPKYQNAMHLAFSVFYLALYTRAINTMNHKGDFDFVEFLLYLFTFGFIYDELMKVWKVGRRYITFWNVFNDTLYALLVVSLTYRIIAHGWPRDSPERAYYTAMSYKFLAFSAPFFWLRLLLFLESFQFFGVMLVVLKTMMQESLIFFALLAVVLMGFMQGFIGLHDVEDREPKSNLFYKVFNVVMSSTDYGSWDKLAPPFGRILYYIYTFIITVMLLKVLVAVYNEAYRAITGNAKNEYLALFSQKTMRFARAPAKDAYIPPFNLVKLALTPLQWFLSKRQWHGLHRCIMTVIYSPALLIIAFLESRQSHRGICNWVRVKVGDQKLQEWEEHADEVDFEADGWSELVEETKPNVVDDAAVLEIKKLRKEVQEFEKSS